MTPSYHVRPDMELFHTPGLCFKKFWILEYLRFYTFGLCSTGIPTTPSSPLLDRTSTFLSQGFALAEPLAQNILPLFIHTVHCLAFKSLLKCHFFLSCQPWSNYLKLPSVCPIKCARALSLTNMLHGSWHTVVGDKEENVAGCQLRDGRRERDSHRGF